jgi:hypothetical protein
LCTALKEALTESDSNNNAISSPILALNKLLWFLKFHSQVIQVGIRILLKISLFISLINPNA